MSLDQQRLVIFGGSSGIGLATARAALDAGATVFLAGRSPEKLAAAAATLATPERVQTIAADIAEVADVARVFATVGEVDHIITTAVTAAYQPVRTFDIAAARRVLDSKIIGALLLAQHGAPRLRAGGSIVLTSGAAADRPAPNGSLIAAANGALASFIRALALELAPVRVNAVSPGWTDTPFWDTIAPTNKSALFAAQAARLPARRIGRPEDAAHAILFLLQNTFTTGTVLDVDGGHRFA